ncbi:MAG: hypothetical protein AAF489_16685 [Bacteroidota bacterium]
MKNLILKSLFIGILLTTSLTTAQSCPIPEPLDQSMVVGKWKGNLTFQGELRALELNLSEENKELKAQLAIPSVSNKTIDTEIEICQSEELHIKFKVENRQYELIGKPKKSAMSGRLISKNSDQFLGNSSVAEVNEIFSLKKSK